LIGFTYSEGDRILVWKQTLASENGIYYAGTTLQDQLTFRVNLMFFEGVQVYVTQRK
jgi:hypothetical protein